jgi:hypothetical protein
VVPRKVKMRNHLDEIVEEETGPAETAIDSVYRDIVLRVAERAFRHALEQCQSTIKPEFHSLAFVQPAPADEKCPNGCWHGRHSWLHGPPLDRRKGERRKGYVYEQRRIVHRTCVVNGNIYAAQQSRSGKDRRIP